MAIHPLMPGIEVIICVNGQPLVEYDDESFPRSIPAANGRDTKVITKYIESVAGKEFSFEYIVHDTYKLDSPAIGFMPEVDNVKLGKKSFTGKPRGGSWPWVERMTEMSTFDSKTRKWMKSTFKFTSIETSLDNNALSQVREDTEKMNKTGQLVVYVFRETEGVIVDWPKTDGNPTLGITTKVHEKALKGNPKYHNVSLGNSQVYENPKTYLKRDYVDGRDSPILKYVFKYRSKEALKQLLIIERTPEPESPPSIDLKRLDKDQRRKVESFVKNLTQSGSSSQSAKVKRERNDDGDTLSPQKKQRPEEVELVDLSGD
ncbi:hypothetical protein BDZ45DRAFT_679972 [Acephala macrosclerotiorum]|nr:hypothetical protein BDZ45DRAFT_679972 [Acephala macrosclerotiorum]